MLEFDFHVLILHLTSSYAFSIETQPWTVLAFVYVFSVVFAEYAFSIVFAVYVFSIEMWISIL